MTIGLNEVKREEAANKKIEKIVDGGSTTQRILFEWLPTLNATIQFCVLINIVLLIMPHIPQSRDFVARNRISKSKKRTFYRFQVVIILENLAQSHGNLISTLENIFVAAYIVECLIKVYIYRWSYFVESWWDRIDFILVLISGKNRPARQERTKLLR